MHLRFPHCTLSMFYEGYSPKCTYFRNCPTVTATCCRSLTALDSGLAGYLYESL